MAKPWIHAVSSAKRYGGIPEDYLKIHNFMDSSKAVIGDPRHRALTHNTWFVGTVLELVFGTTFKNSDGKDISTRDIGEQHCLEDFGGRFIPSAQDYLQEMEMQDWMQNGHGVTPSFARIDVKLKKKIVTRTIEWSQLNVEREVK